MRVAVIGGGPSGLVQLKTLLSAHRHFPSEKPIEAKLFEAYDEVGGVFLHHVYEDAELVSSKYLTTFSDFRPRPEDKDFFSAERYREYLNEYATQFQLWPHMHLSTRVIAVKRGDTSGHLVIYQGPDGAEVEWECDAIAVCSGVHSKANIPHIPGIENVPTVIHSQDFKKREQLGKDTTVMILGSGETGFDMAYLGITSPTKRVVLCHRDGWIGAPKRAPIQRFLPWMLGSKPFEHDPLPVDVSQITLFDTMYVHPIVRNSMLIWDYYHFVALTAGCWLTGGSTYGVDQWVGQVYGERFHTSRLFWNKAWQRISNYVSTPYRPTKWPLGTRIRQFFFNVEFPAPKRVIDIAPFPSHIDVDGIAHFPYNGRPESERIKQTIVKPDVIVLATGYVPGLPYLNTKHNDGRRPYPVSTDADIRHIWSSEDPTIGFIGFIRPGFGAIPPLSELQAMLFTQNLLGRVSQPLLTDDEWHYRMIHPPQNRINYGVEHDSYAYQLAKDIGGAASFTQVLGLAFRTRRGWRLPYVWAGGASFNAKFRMVGPWRFDGAAEILTGEMWETITRRENLFGNFSLSILPMIYLGSLSLAACLYSGFRSALSKLGICQPYVPRNMVKEKFEELARREEMLQNQKVAMNGKATGLIGEHVVEINGRL